MLCSKCGSSLDENGKCPFCDKVEEAQKSMQQVQPQPQAPKDSSKKYKIAILAFLIIIVGLLSVLLMTDTKKASNTNDNNNGTAVVTAKDVLKENGNVSRTVMIYMVGADLESDMAIATADLNGIKPSEVDLEHVDVLLYTGGTKEWHNDFVSNDENAIFHLTKNGFEKVKSYDKANMGSSKTLATFLTYAYDNYKNDRFDLIFYDHGSAIAGAISDQFTNDNLQVTEFTEALEESPFSLSNRLEAVIFRTCLNGTIEVASAFDDYAYYFVGSEEITSGNAFTSTLKFINNIDKDDTAVEFCKRFIDAYDKAISQIRTPLGYPKVYAIVDLNKIDELWDAIENFIDKVDLDNNFGDIVRLRDSLFQFAYTFHDEAEFDMVDLYSLIEGLDPYSSEEASKVLKIFDEAIVYNWASSDDFHGLSIYFPYRAENTVKKTLLKIYKKWGTYTNYTKFITAFNDKNTSNTASSFANFSTGKNETQLSDNNEFSVKLSEDQIKDYGNAIYILFVKNDEGLYRPVYSSDNAILEDGYLKTKIENNLIKIKDKSDGTEEYITLVERQQNGKRSLTSTAVLQYVPGKGDPNGRLKSVASTVYFDYKNNKPYVSSYIKIGEGAAGGAVLNPDDYNVIDYLYTGYKIFDENGKYTDDWDNNGNMTVYEFKTKDIEYSKSSLDKAGDYYCVFKIQDIYGNIYYSDFINLKK